ncbi:MAG: hypothetical protein H6684_04780 [Deltaproteobacteria bacterium]|nr:hypothetical protein [bacterium]MCB9475910.1 hypothetical protein [Deltaproteobacteria bacterium]MCB9479697.1 hypothetical protein [Deltaproteobacteria bacterium]MCB9488028.1 hypothetical protein [Deltaproteobacteria bacterium]
MNRLWIVSAVVILALVMGLAGVVACSEDNSEDDSSSSLKRIPILVKQDDFFDFPEDEVIGRVEYTKTRGPAGSLIVANCVIDRLTTIAEDPDNRAVNVRVELRNQDASREEFETLEWVQTSNEQVFEVYVPLVETVPVVLNFQLVVSRNDETAADDDDDDNDTADDDTTDDDTADDDTAADDDDDDDDDGTPIFKATADMTFVVSSGRPIIGD